ncbi:division/cell wall cluster transcriptional repressor MraZ [Christensenellaceae bacterium OttesenSCG-928-L17]|nr:division/cell wall cluster transcriptional repressor MraZ [Christensenellaceae bacterium OttesenSCG-928-L17]
MLISSFNHGIDAKGRVFVPAKWREDLGTTVYLTHGFLGDDDARCLFGMSEKKWIEFSERVSGVSEFKMLSQQMLRMLFMNACECELDKQGRILIPTQQREYIGVEKDIVLVGVHKRFEVWEPNMLNAHTAKAMSDYNAALMELVDGNI